MVLTNFIFAYAFEQYKITTRDPLTAVPLMASMTVLPI